MATRKPAVRVNPAAPMSSGDGSPSRDFMRSTYEVARKEVLQHIRTKRLLIIGAFFFLSLQLVTLVFPLSFDDEIGNPDEGEPSTENLFLFIHLNASIFGGLFAVTLLCIVLTADAVCSEWQNRSIFLLLSKPVSRTAFVVGKYVGSVLSIVPTIWILYTVQYLVMMAVYEGQPTAREVGGFIAGLGMLGLGSLAVAAVALFFSTLTRSTVSSLVFTLLSVFILFPIVGAISDIQYVVAQENGENPDEEAWKYDWSHYMSPERVMAGAGPFFAIEGDEDFQSFSVSLVPQRLPERQWMSILAGVAFVAAFVSASIWRVHTRNFE
jgi:ABC-type transport system involved in multi-copper enzyme maturation permease subunit